MIRCHRLDYHRRTAAVGTPDALYNGMQLTPILNSNSSMDGRKKTRPNNAASTAV